MPTDKRTIVIASLPYQTPGWPATAPALLSACLNKAGISAVPVDLAAEFVTEFVDKTYWPELLFYISQGPNPDRKLPRRVLIDVLKWNKQKLIDIKQKYDPDIIGLSVFSVMSETYLTLMCYSIRRWLPGVKILAGGRGLEILTQGEYTGDFHATGSRARFLVDHGMIDCAVTGDAESFIVDVIKQDMYGVVDSPPQTSQDLNAVPIPDWDNYNFDIYQRFNPSDRYLLITDSKGCVRKCTFCDVEHLWPKYIFKDGELLAEEMIKSYHRTGIDFFRFSGNLINGSIPNYRKMNQYLADHLPRTLRYSGYAIFRGKENQPPRDFELAAQAGCSEWIIGVESGSERVRYDMRKKFTNTDIDYTAHQLHDNGIKQVWLFMAGYPMETEQDFEETLNLLRRYQHWAKDGLLRVAISSPFTLGDQVPLTNDSRLRDHYHFERENIVKGWSHIFWSTPTNPDNTYERRFDRYRRFLELQHELGFGDRDGQEADRMLREQQEVYEQYIEAKKSKKSFAIRQI